MLLYSLTGQDLLIMYAPERVPSDSGPKHRLGRVGPAWEMSDKEAASGALGW